MVFGGLNLAAVALFVVCFTLLPILSLRPRKFAILYVRIHFFPCTFATTLSIFATIVKLREITIDRSRSRVSAMEKPTQA